MAAPSTSEELDCFYKGLSEAGKAVILSLIPGYADEYRALSCRGVLPDPLQSLFDRECLELTFPELLNKCETVYEHYTLTDKMAHNMEVYTKGQAQSKVWFQQ